MAGPATPAEARLGAKLAAPRTGVGAPVALPANVRPGPATGAGPAAAEAQEALAVHVEASVRRKPAALLVDDAPGAVLHGRPEVAPRREASAHQTDPGLPSALTAVPRLATAAGEAMVGVGGTGAVVPLPALAGGPLPLGLAKRVALQAAATGTGGVAKGVVPKGGEAALAPVVLTARQAPATEPGLVQTTRSGTARAVVHVGRVRITPTRATPSSDAPSATEGREGPDSRKSDP